MTSIEDNANRAANAFRHAAALLSDAADLLNEFALRAKKHESVAQAREPITRDNASAYKRVVTGVCEDPACPWRGKHRAGTLHHPQTFGEVPIYPHSMTAQSTQPVSGVHTTGAPLSHPSAHKV